MHIQKVEVQKVENSGKELAENFFRVCAFCDKIVRVSPYNFKSCLQLSGNKFYCPFCLRHNHHHRSNRNILMLSFRGMIGYYYYRLYNVNPRQMYFSELTQYIDNHCLAGLQSPVLSYDPTTFMWFLDFNRIGVDRHKAPISDVQLILRMTFETFELKKYINSCAVELMYERFEKAVMLFYEKRVRPKDRKALIPTFQGILAVEKPAFFKDTRDFLKNDLSPR